MVGIVERLVPDEWWDLFQRVVPEVPSRPQGGGRRRPGDREVLAAIVFVAFPVKFFCSDLLDVRDQAGAIPV